MRLMFLTAVALLSLSVPASLQGQVAAHREARAEGPVADTLRATARRMAELLRARDIEGVIDLYGDTVHFVHVEEGRIIPWSQLAAMMRSYLTSVESNPVSIIGDPGVTLVDEDDAVIYIVHRFDGGADRESHTGVWTGVMHRFHDGWKIVHSHSSDLTE